MRVRQIAIAALVLAGMTPLAAQQPMTQGIKVHGDWTIEVRQPDGTLVTRREFKNAFKPEGAGVLNMLLTTKGPPFHPAWLVSVTTPNSAQSICDGVTCGTSQPFPVTGNYPKEQTLVVSNVNNSIVLDGSIIATRDGTIGSVGTVFNLCESTSQCNFSSPFSGTTLPSQISVKAGQIVQVKVVISFS